MDGKQSNIDQVVERAEAAGFAYERLVRQEKYHYVKIHFPNGRTTREFFVTEDQAAGLLKVDLASITFLGDYIAVHDRVANTVEALCHSPRSPSIERELKNLPGVEQLSPEGDRGYPPATVRLSVTSDTDGAALEISPAGFIAGGRVFGLGSYSLKMNLSEGLAHDDALAELERVALPFLFDLDVRYGITVQMATDRSSIARVARSVPVEEEPRYPVRSYDREPLDLYTYASNARGLPLLEFLALYQCLEFYFPFFAQKEAIERVRNEISLPSFSARSDQDIKRVLDLGTAHSRASSELDQLKATVIACIDEARLRSWIERSDESKNHFCASRQTVRNVSKISLEANDDIRNQVASRIYDIRCRVVHIKQGGGNSNIELLLPTSREARSLGEDIELLRYLAQRAIALRSQAFT